MTTLIEAFNEATEKSLNTDKLSHAYLIELSAESDYNEVIKFAKKIIKQAINSEEDKNKSDYLIDINNHPDFRIIKNEGNWIKKEQIQEIQAEFTNKSIYNGKRVYIIEEAEKLNKSSANTLLKFLEEPSANIIGILTTKNRYIVIDTIVSRCQYFNIAVKNRQKIEKDEVYIKNLIDFVTMMEEKKEKSIAYFSLFNQDILTQRIELKTFLSDILLLYNDVLYVMIKRNPVYFYENQDILEKIAKNNDKESIERKINALNECIEKLKYNVNIKLLLDKLNILMRGMF